MLDHSEKPGYVCLCRSTPGGSKKYLMIMPTFANILYDEAFKLVLSAPANRPLLVKLVEFFLPGLKIHSLTLDDKEQHGLVLSDKSSIFDLYCTTDKGEQLIVEMQFSSQESFRDRMLYYATFPIRMQMNRRMKELQKQAEEGKPVNKMDYSLSPIYVISILNFRLPHQSTDFLEEGLISRYSLRSPDGRELMTDALHFVYLELGRLRWKQTEQHKCRTLLEQLAFSLKYGHLLPQRPESFEDEMLRMLFEATAFANMDEVQLNNYNKLMRTELDIIAITEYARKEGLKEGREQGREEKTRETARNFLKLGVAVDIIAKATGLSEQEILALK